MPQCSVPMCVKQGGHKFPIDLKMSRKWVVAIKRNDPNNTQKIWTPCKTARICSDHFCDTDYIAINLYGNVSAKKQLKPGSVPSVFKCWDKGTSEQTVARRARATKRKLEFDDTEPWANVGNEVTVEKAIDENNNVIDQHEEEFKKTDVYVQTEGNPRQLYTVRNFTNDNLHHLTGLETYDKFKTVLDSLGPAVNHLNYYHGIKPTLNIEDQFFVTLIKLRTHPSNKTLCIDFDLNERQVSNIFITWINFMYVQWSEIDWWPSRELVKYYAPTDFFCKFPNTRCVVDGTECPIMSPKQPIAQQATFSTYKNRNTVKALIGSSPGGLITYISECYGGSTTDRQIVERSNLPQLCDPGDEVMADKGFNVEDIFIPYQVSINIPTFFRKKNRMSNETVLRDRKISSKRVHIERLIGLGKTYKILTHPMTNVESSLSSRIVFVVYTLCNFRKCIIPVNA